MILTVQYTFERLEWAEQIPRVLGYGTALNNFSSNTEASGQLTILLNENKKIYIFVSTCILVQRNSVNANKYTCFNESESLLYPIRRSIHCRAQSHHLSK